MIDKYDDLPSVKDYLIKYSLIAKKSFGQNFLTNLEITDRIAKSIPDISEKTIIEIGAGPGSLTRAILKNNPKKLIAIEIDETALQIQSEIKNKYKDKLEIINKDALNITLHDLKEFSKNTPIHICGNLPYNISVPLLINWLHIIYDTIKGDKSSFINGMTLMFQKEVSTRILSTSESAKNKKDYSRLSILSNWLCKTNKLFDLPPSCFTPAPKIVSTVIQFIPYDNIPFDEEYNTDILKLEHLIKVLFSNRRKMIRGILSNFDWAKVKISPTKRPEDLTIKELCELSTYI